MDDKICRYLDEHGIKHSNIGYRYLAISIQIGTEDPVALYKISKVYNQVAQLYGTNERNVERAIRHSISKTNKTNKEFIVCAFDEIFPERDECFET